MTNSLFNSKVQNKKLASKISITSPTAFRNSIRQVGKNGYTLEELRALQLAENRAKAQLKRKDLSSKERKQLKEISKVKIPWGKYKGK